MYLQPQFSGKSKYLICFFMHTFTQKSLRCALPSKVVTLFLEQMFMLKSQTNKPPQTNKTNHSKWNPKPSIPKFLLFFSPLYLTSHTSYLNGILYAPPLLASPAHFHCLRFHMLYKKEHLLDTQPHLSFWFLTWAQLLTAIPICNLDMLSEQIAY